MQNEAENYNGNGTKQTANSYENRKGASTSIAIKLRSLYQSLFLSQKAMGQIRLFRRIRLAHTLITLNSVYTISTKSAASFSQVIPLISI